MGLRSGDILSITPGGVLCRDQYANVRWIDFKTCNRNWIANREHVTLFDAWCVGQRNTGNSTLLDVEFFCEPRVIFEFNSYAQRDRILLEPMRQFGWHTWDAG